MDKNPYHLLKPLVFNENWKTFEEYLAGEKLALLLSFVIAMKQNLRNCKERLK